MTKKQRTAFWMAFEVRTLHSSDSFILLIKNQYHYFNTLNFRNTGPSMAILVLQLHRSMKDPIRNNI